MRSFNHVILTTLVTVLIHHVLVQSFQPNSYLTPHQRQRNYQNLKIPLAASSNKNEITTDELKVQLALYLKKRDESNANESAKK